MALNGGVLVARGVYRSLIENFKERTISRHVNDYLVKLTTNQ